MQTIVWIERISTLNTIEMEMETNKIDKKKLNSVEIFFDSKRN